MSVSRAKTHIFLQKKAFFGRFGAVIRAGKGYFRKKKTQFFWESENNRLLKKSEHPGNLEGSFKNEGNNLALLE